MCLRVFSGRFLCDRKVHIFIAFKRSNFIRFYVLLAFLIQTSAQGLTHVPIGYFGEISLSSHLREVVSLSGRTPGVAKRREFL